MKDLSHHVRLIKTTDPYTDILEVYVPHLPFSVVSAWFFAGSRFDPKNKEGLAHLFEHLFATRSHTYKTNEERLNTLAKRGIIYNAFTTSELSFYYHYQQPERTKESLSLLMDSLQEPVFTTDDLAKEKSVVCNEMEQNKNEPGTRLWQLSKKALWSGHPLERAFFGTPESLDRITVSDLEFFYTQHYQQKKKVYCIFSPIPTLDSTDIIKTARKPMLEKKKEIQSHPALEKPIPQIIENSPDDMAHLSVSYRTVPISQERDVQHLQVIRDYLGNYWASQLVTSLRLKHSLTYWVQATTEHFSDTGYFAITVHTKKEHVQNVLAVIEQEIEKLSQGIINTELLKQTIAVYKTSKASSLLTVEGLLWWYGESALHSTHTSNPADYFKALDAIDPQQLCDTAHTYLKQEHRSIVILDTVS